jgi:hypothetical protein
MYEVAVISSRRRKEMTPGLFNGKERRGYVRLETSLPIRIKISGKDMGKIYSATTKNISHGYIVDEFVGRYEEYK